MMHWRSGLAGVMLLLVSSVASAVTMDEPFSNTGPDAFDLADITIVADDGFDPAIKEFLTSAEDYVSPPSSVRFVGKSYWPYRGADFTWNFDTPLDFYNDGTGVVTVEALITADTTLFYSLLSGGDEVMGTAYNHDPEWRTITFDLSTLTDPTKIDQAKAIDSVRFRVARPAGSGAWRWSSALIDDFRVVPEPITASLLALGGVALLKRRRN